MVFIVLTSFLNLALGHYAVQIGMVMRDCYRRLQPQENAEPAASQADPDTAIGAAAADTDICAHRGLDGFAVRSTADQKSPGRNKKHHT